MPNRIALRDVPDDRVLPAVEYRPISVRYHSEFYDGCICRYCWEDETWLRSEARILLFSPREIARFNRRVMIVQQAVNPARTRRQLRRLNHGTWERYSSRRTRCRCDRCKKAWSEYCTRKNHQAGRCMPVQTYRLIQQAKRKKVAA